MVNKFTVPPKNDEIVNKVNEIIDNIPESSVNIFGISTSSATSVEKVISIPNITELKVGQQIIVHPTNTSTVANSTIKLNDFTAYPMRYNNAAITTSTDSIVWNANYVSQFIFDGTYWQFLGHGLDSNTTYTLNYSINAGAYKSGVGAYAISRYSLIMQTVNGGWEKITATGSNYSTGTAKSVNTNGFILSAGIKFYNSTTVLANGNLSAANVVYDKAASVDLRYSTNCGATPNWEAGDYIYLVGSINTTDSLFYLDTTTWWTNSLPTTNDGKLYVRLGHFISDAKITLYSEHPIFYHNGIKLCEYNIADNKQDILKSGENIKTINNISLLGRGNILITDSNYIAEYNVTSFSDIQNAYNNSNKKNILCLYTITFGEEEATAWNETILLKLVAHDEAHSGGGAMESPEVFYFEGSYGNALYKTSAYSGYQGTEWVPEGWGQIEETYTDFANKDLSNVSSISSSSAVYTELNNRANKSLSNLTTAGNNKFQAPLVSGTNIKTINNESILGSGNIEIQGGGTITVDQTFDGTSVNAQSGVAIAGELGNYAPLYSDVEFNSIDISDLITFGNSVSISAVTDTETGEKKLIVYAPQISIGTNDYYLGITSNGVSINGNEVATQSWVQNQGYLTGITSANVTSALGYTPVNKSGDTMSGALNFSNSGFGVISLKNISTGEYSDINFIQANNNRVGFIRANNVSSTKRNIQISVCNDSGSPTSIFTAGCDNNVNYCTFPNTTCVDGQWVHSQTIAGTSTTKGTYNIDLSSYLPNDNYQYEVMINLRAYSSNSSNAGEVFVYSDIFTKTAYSSINISGQGGAGGNSRQIGNTFILPIGTGRRITYEIESYNVTDLDLVLWGYRRLGTNA